MKKIIKLAVLIGILSTVAFAFGTKTDAEYVPQSRNTCSLIVMPFNAENPPIPGNLANQYINFLTENTCKNFITYPNAYSPQPPRREDNPLNPNVTEEHHIPVTGHSHTYYNDSVHDTFFYRSFLYKFEITLRSDGVNSIDTDEIKCFIEDYDIPELESCQGTADDLWGGTEVSKETRGDNLVITWQFSTLGGPPPVIWGNNGPNFTVGDFTNEEDRRMRFFVDLPSKDNNEIWSATTSSRALVGDLAILKEDFDPNRPTANWEYLPPHQGFETEETHTGRTFYWFPIGTSTTVWKKTEPPPPNICELLRINDPVEIPEDEIQNITDDPEVDRIYLISLSELIFSEGFIPQEARIHWTTTDPNGRFWVGTRTMIGTFNEVGNNAETPIQPSTNLNQVWYSGEGTIRARVTQLPDDQIGPECDHSVTIPPPPDPDPECQTLVVNQSQEEMEVGIPVEFTSHAIDTDGNLFDSQIEYSVTPEENGEFFINGVSQGSSVTVDPHTTVEFVPLQEGTFAIRINTLDTNVPNCEQEIKVEIPEEPSILCRTLRISTPTPIQDSETIEEITGRDDLEWIHRIALSNLTFEGPMPEETRIRWTTTDPNGEFWIETDNGYNYEGNTTSFPAKTPTTRNRVWYAGAGQITATVEGIPEEQIGEGCIFTVEIPEDILPPDCLDLELSIYEYTNGEIPTSTLVENSFYRMRAFATYTQNEPQNTDIIYKIDPAFGLFVPTRLNNFFQRQMIRAAQEAENLTSEVVNTIPLLSSSPEIQVPPHTEVSLIIFSDIPGLPGETTPNVVEIFPVEFEDHEICHKKLPVTKRKEEKEPPDEIVPPKITKVVYPEDKSDQKSSRITIHPDTEFVTYLVGFIPGNDIDEVTLTDNKIVNGVIESALGSRLIFQEIEITVGEKEKWESGTPIGRCDTEDEDNVETETQVCHTGNAEDFGNGDSLTFLNVNSMEEDEIIIIEYKMRVEVDKEVVCSTPIEGFEYPCGDSLINEVEFTAPSLSTEEIYTGKDSARITILCPFILMRAAGEVLFYKPIPAGVDISRCTIYKNATGPGIIPRYPPDPGDPPVPTGPPIDLPVLTHPSYDICSFSNLDTNIEGYDNVLKNFSSTICEMRAEISERWMKTNIDDAIHANMTRISRWRETLNTTSLTEVPAGIRSGVVVTKNRDLTIGVNGIPFIVEETQGTPSAQTYLVKNGDLKIMSDIKYGDLGIEEFTNNPKNIPSAAFIVINGDICIHPDIKRIDGILMASDIKGSGKGQIKSCPREDGTTVSEEFLRINGSLIGNVLDLFQNRVAVGDPRKDQGSVTIRYNQRILLNTPPGISEMINIRQAIVP